MHSIAWSKPPVHPGLRRLSDFAAFLGPYTHGKIPLQY